MPIVLVGGTLSLILRSRVCDEISAPICSFQVVELEFQVKWKRVKEAMEVLRRMLVTLNVNFFF